MQEQEDGDYSGIICRPENYNWKHRTSFYILLGVYQVFKIPIPIVLAGQGTGS